MLADRIFLDRRYEQFEESEYGQTYFDTETRAIYRVQELECGSTSITEIPEDADDYSRYFERYMKARGEKYNITLELFADEVDPDEVKSLIRVRLGDDIFIKNLKVEKEAEEK